ncbi:class I SAM-dependent methyltransferase [Muricoccus radiodurans]|uniref:class I SAM-dependent methyltransferase n=1 Tax=Muricoccus radiodurans TaxID=2231721 RepID=UPI003CF848F3
MTAGQQPDATAGQAKLWAAGEVYGPYVGRWSRLVAPRFLDWLEPPQDARWLDVGCGTGALSGAILGRCAPVRVVDVDSSAGFLSYARRQVVDPRMEFHEGDAQSLPVAAGTFDLAVSGLVLNFVPDQAKGVEEMRRAVRKDGQVAAYIWDYANGMQMMRRFRDTAAQLDAGVAGRDESLRFPLCQPGPLKDLFEEAGMRGVEVTSIKVPTVSRDFDDYWRPFLGGGAPAPSYCMSHSEDRRAALRDRLQAALPTNEDGSIHLTARAWAVRGTV